MTIQFFTEEFDFSLQNEAEYIDWLEAIAHHHQITIAELSYIFSHDEYILNLNKEYLDHDYYTDILSFPIETNPIKGDIFISIERVKENAQKHDATFLDELHRVMAHGLLHFLGFDDHKEEDIEEMRQQEGWAITLFQEMKMN